MNTGKKEERQPGLAGLVVRCSIQTYQEGQPERMSFECLALVETNTLPPTPHPTPRPHPLLGLPGRWRRVGGRVFMCMCVLCVIDVSVMLQYLLVCMCECVNREIEDGLFC